MSNTSDVSMGVDARSGRRARPYRGSAILQSSIQRFFRVLAVVALMWLLAGWSMDWW